MSSFLPPLYDKEVTCLLCNHLFTTKKVRQSVIRTLSEDTDFCFRYKEPELNPNYYYVNVCPACGFSFTQNTNIYFPKNSKETIQEHITSKWKHLSMNQERTIQQAIISFKLAIYIAGLKEEKPILIAGLCHRLAWLYRELQHEEEQRFLKLAYEYYQDSFASSDYLKFDIPEMRILYLLGELARRLGQNREAIQFFSKVVSHPEKEVYPIYTERAREQWKTIRRR